VAARLAEVSDWKILLVEAGGDQPSKSRVPWFHLWLPNSPIDWRYVTEPQPNIMRGFKENVSRFRETDIVLDYLRYIGTKSQLSSFLMEFPNKILCVHVHLNLIIFGLSFLPFGHIS
jgi:hypothetical protein